MSREEKVKVIMIEVSTIKIFTNKAEIELHVW